MSDPVQNPYIASQANSDSEAGGPELAGLVRVGQIITFALVQGVVVIAAILYFTVAKDAKFPGGAGDNAMNESDWIFLAIGIAAAVGACVFAFVVPKMIRKVAINKYHGSETQTGRELATDEIAMTSALKQLVGSDSSARIVGQAILEGAAIMNLVLMMLDDNLLHLGVALALLVGIVIQFPMLGKTKAFLRSAMQSNR